MAVDAGLVELLVCPECRGAVEYKDRRGLIICTQCNLHYPVRDGIPVMLVDEATRPGRRAGGRDSGA